MTTRSDPADTITVNPATLTPHEAVNLASRLLQFATQAVRS